MIPSAVVKYLQRLHYMSSEGIFYHEEVLSHYLNPTGHVYDTYDRIGKCRYALFDKSGLRRPVPSLYKYLEF